MKNSILYSFLFVLLAAFVAPVKAQTISITSTSLELIAPNAVTRTFYDLDQVYLAYKAGKVSVFDSESGTQLFLGDTSEVSVTSANIWTAKATRLARWYQSTTHTNGYRYFMPRRGVQYLFRGATNAIRFLNYENKRTLLETHIDSVTVAGVSGSSAKLTWLRNQAFLEGNRNQRSLPEAVTVSAGAAAGTGPTIAVTGTANDFQVTLTTGSSPTTTGVLFTVTLPNTYLTAGIPSVSAGDEDASAHITRVFATATTTTYVLSANGTALAAATQYVFNCRYAGRD